MKVCVFLSAQNSLDTSHRESVMRLSQCMVKHNMSLVYGGANVGLMGMLANSIMSLGGEVIGVMPRDILSNEIAHTDITCLHYVNSMQERKLKMQELADAFICLPGGLGTLEELFEVWNAIKIGVFNKPLGLINTNGFFDLLLNFLLYSQNEGFMKKEHLELIKVSDEPHDILDFFIDTERSMKSVGK